MWSYNSLSEVCSPTPSVKYEISELKHDPTTNFAANVENMCGIKIL